VNRRADCGETVVLVPLVVEPVQVQVTLTLVPIQIRHVAVVVDLDHHVQDALHATVLRPSSGLYCIRGLKALQHPAPSIFMGRKRRWHASVDQ
jgi:hypothetical protein